MSKLFVFGFVPLELRATPNFGSPMPSLSDKISMYSGKKKNALS